MMQLEPLQVDQSVTKLDSRVPPLLSKPHPKLYPPLKKAPEAARVVASELKRAGVVDTASSCAKSVYSKCEPTAKDLYAKYEPKAEQCAVSAWRKVNQVLPKVVDVVVPTAAYCSEKYNQTVQSTAEKGYRVSFYLPLVPTEKIAKVFAEKAPEAEPLVASHGETEVATH